VGGVAGDEYNRILAGIGQSAMDAGERTTSWAEVRHYRQAKIRIFVGLVGNDEALITKRTDDVCGMQDQGFATVGV